MQNDLEDLRFECLKLAVQHGEVHPDGVIGQAAEMVGFVTGRHEIIKNTEIMVFVDETIASANFSASLIGATPAVIDHIRKQVSDGLVERYRLERPS